MLVTEDPATVSSVVMEVSSVVMKVAELYAVDLPNVSSLSGEINNCLATMQCGDESGGAICCRPPKCVFSQW